MTTDTKQRLSDIAEDLDILTSKLPAHHPSVMQARENAKKHVAFLYELAGEALEEPMNETQKADALRLADELDSVVPIDSEQEVSLEAASSTLRSQHAEIEALHQAAAAGKQLLKAHADRIRDLEAELRGSQADVAIRDERVAALVDALTGMLRATDFDNNEPWVVAAHAALALAKGRRHAAIAQEGQS